MRKTGPRVFVLALLALFAWTCNLSNSRGDDTLTLRLGDSLKVPQDGKYDSLQIWVFVVKNSGDTIYRKSAFHGPYRDAAQLENMNIGKLPSNDFVVVIMGYRNKTQVLGLALKFNAGVPADKTDTLLVPPDTARHSNHAPGIFLASPDSGKTLFRIKEGAALAFKVVAKDTDAGDSAVLLSLPALPPTKCGLATYDTLSGVFSFKPAFTCVDSSGDSAVINLKFKAKDRGNPILFDSIIIRLAVQDSESAPRWKNTQPFLQGKQGRTLSLDLDTAVYLGDAEGDSVSFSVALGTVGQNPLRWSFTPSFSDSGMKTVFITATDSHKPSQSSQLTVKLQIADSSRVLDVVINSPRNGFVTRDTVIPILWSVNGGLQKTDTTERLTQEGQNMVRRFYRDTLTGDTASDAITVIRDRTPPAIAILSPRNNYVTNRSSVTVDWTLDGKAQTPFVQLLADGVNTVSVSRPDSVGNVGAASITVYRRPNVIFVRKGAKGDGSSWEEAIGELGDVMDLQTVYPKGTQVWVAKGTYAPTAAFIFDGRLMHLMQVKTDMEIYGGFSDSGIATGVSQRNWIANQTIINLADSIESDPFATSDSIANVVIDGFVFSGFTGRAISIASPSARPSKNLNISNCTFQNPKGLTSPILLAYLTARLDNVSIIGSGGQEFTSLIQAYEATLTVTKLTAENYLGLNSAIDANGGLTVVRNSRFVNNRKVDSTGSSTLSSFHLQSGSQLDIDFSTIEGGRTSITVDPGATLIYGDNNILP